MQGMISLICLLEWVLHGNLGWIQEKDLSTQCEGYWGFSSWSPKVQFWYTCVCPWEFPKDMEISHCSPGFQTWQARGCPASGMFLQSCLGGFCRYPLMGPDLLRTKCRTEFKIMAFATFVKDGETSAHTSSNKVIRRAKDELSSAQTSSFQLFLLQATFLAVLRAVWVRGFSLSSSVSLPSLMGQHNLIFCAFPNQLGHD